MAKATLSAFLEEVSGKLGNSVIFRRQLGKIVLVKLPTLTAEPTAAQLQARERFRQAAAYAREALKDPDIRARYQVLAEQQQNTLMGVALRDYFRPPEVGQLDVSMYQGQAGNSIRIQVGESDILDYVLLRIYRADGSLAESGTALQQANSIDWWYTASSTQDSVYGLRIVAELRDLPGKITREEITLP